MEDRKIFSLLDVTRSIRKTLKTRYGTAFWVKAEMTKLNFYPHSGHCYPDLVEKKNGKIVAQLRANLWRADYQRVNKKFLHLLKEPLKDNIKILFLGRIGFDEKYGLSLHILDIDPSFTLGDMEKDRQETLRRLKKEGLLKKNQQLRLPLLVKRIAVISVETSKGYADFRRVVEENEWGYSYFYFLFPSLLQGDRAVISMKNALEQIKKVKEHFDMVAIIRGGGGEIGLSCYNHYELARAIAEFPLPVLTGIGHATNLTVAEMVASQNCITPTKLGEWLLEKTFDFADQIREAQSLILNKAQQTLSEQKQLLQAQGRHFKMMVSNKLDTCQNQLKQMTSYLGRGVLLYIKERRTFLLQQRNDLIKTTQGFILQQEKELEHGAQSIKLLDPKNVLKRGYSITYLDDKSLTDIGQAKVGQVIKTQLKEGFLKSKVSIIQKEEDHG